MELIRRKRDGALERLELGPRPVFEALAALDPLLHLSIELRGEALEATAWPLTHRPQSLGTGLFCAAVGGERRWLGRTREGPELRFGERGERRALAGAEVPVTWIGQALGELLRGRRFSPHLPWHREPGRDPIGRWRAEGFSFAALQGASPEARRALLEALHAELFGRWRRVKERPEELAEAIAELRRVGHDLWSHDVRADGGQRWGHDYMRPAEGAGLALAYGLAGEAQEGEPWLSLRFGAVEVGEEPEEE